jgi:hypothetical protein
MKIKKSILFGLFIGILLGSCTPDLDLNAEYKDITIVFGLLNPSDSSHYVKIYKGFLTDGNAYEVASYLENISYIDSIDVTLEEYVNDALTRTIQLDTTTAVSKDSGDFAYPLQILYYTNETLNQTATYKLKIVNKYTGKVVTGETPVVNNFVISSPTTSTLNLNIVRESFIKFTKAANATAYDIYETFYYFEVDKGTGEITKGSITRKINSSMLRSQSTEISQPYKPSQIITAIANNLEPDNSVIRYRDGYDCVEMKVWAAEDDYVTYLDVNTQSSGVVLDRNEFTNLVSDDKSALGIFSSRNVAIKTFDISNASEDSLVRGSVTENLGFDYYRNYVPAKRGTRH